MADFGIAEGIALASLLTTAAIGTASAVDAHELQKEAQHKQEEAQQKAETEQREADQRAEKKRLEGLKANAEATDYGNVWGADSAKYADAAQKLSAGTGSFDTDDDDENPFYQKGLL